VTDVLSPFVPHTHTLLHWALLRFNNARLGSTPHKILNAMLEYIPVMPGRARELSPRVRRLLEALAVLVRVPGIQLQWHAGDGSPLDLAGLRLDASDAEAELRTDDVDSLVVPQSVRVGEWRLLRS
jgi:hypothetical protein